MVLRRIKLEVGNRTIGKAVTFAYKYGKELFYIIPTYQLTVFGTDDLGKSVKKDFEVFRFGVAKESPTDTPHVVGLTELQTHVIKAWLPNYSVHSHRSIEKGAWQVYKNFLIHDGPDDPVIQVYASIGCIEICGGPHGFDRFNDLIISLSGSKKTSRDEQLAEIGRSGTMMITYLKADRPRLVPL